MIDSNDTVTLMLKNLCNDIERVQDELEDLRKRVKSLVWLSMAGTLPLEAIAAEVASAYSTETKIRQVVLFRETVQKHSGTLLPLVEAKHLMDNAWAARDLFPKV